MRTLPLLAAAAGMAWAAPALAQSELPDGTGKDVVQIVCTECHEADVILKAGGTHDEWAMAVQQMIDMGAMIKPEQISVITDYLAAHFPPKVKPQAATISGTVEASFREWALPTRAFPHDPYAAPDGSIWYTGQLGNVLGRVDPATGNITASSATKTAISGSPPISAAISASSIPRPASSPNTVCPKATIRTRPSSIMTASSGSRCRAEI
jgi:virginiamycin B lyase